MLKKLGKLDFEDLFLGREEDAEFLKHIEFISNLHVKYDKKQTEKFCSKEYAELHLLKNLDKIKDNLSKLDIISDTCDTWIDNYKVKQLSSTFAQIAIYKIEKNNNVKPKCLICSPDKLNLYDADKFAFKIWEE